MQIFSRIGVDFFSPLKFSFSSFALLELLFIVHPSSAVVGESVRSQRAWILKGGLISHVCLCVFVSAITSRGANF